eukprot:6213081-Pleurochrysis_carterae.AAC.1
MAARKGRSKLVVFSIRNGCHDSIRYYPWSCAQPKRQNKQNEAIRDRRRKQHVVHARHQLPSRPDWE